jgi:hypothetical protein
VLVELDEDRAVPLLCNQLAAENQRLVRRAVCMALRHVKRPESLERHALALLAGDASSRLAAAEIAGWAPAAMPESTLAGAIATERLEHVRRRFVDAANARDVGRHVANVLRDLPAGNVLRQWYLVDALFDAAPPECLGRQGDPLWIGPAYDYFPPALQDYVQQRYRDELKRIERELR